jgi:hypothetical protein
MNGSPLTAWEGVEAYYTFADRPFLIALGLAAMAIVTLGVIIHSAKHETAAFKRFP